MKQGMEDQSPGTGKPTRRDTALPGLRKQCHIHFQISASVIILIFRPKGGLQTDGLLKLEELKPNIKEPMLGTESPFTIMQNIVPYLVLLKQCPKKPLLQTAPESKSTSKRR